MATVPFRLPTSVIISRWYIFVAVGVVKPAIDSSRVPFESAHVTTPAKTAGFGFVVGASVSGAYTAGTSGKSHVENTELTDNGFVEVTELAGVNPRKIMPPGCTFSSTFTPVLSLSNYPETVACSVVISGSAGVGGTGVFSTPVT